MDILPNVDKIVIPIQKIKNYALTEPNKAKAFKNALGVI
jgi:hypothetical protein